MIAFTLGQIFLLQTPIFSQTHQKPNIIFILVDDLGVGDVGVFFQNQRKLINNRSKPFFITPYLDSMAKNGAMLDQYCAAPVCAPSRASIMLGQSQGHSNVRDNQFDKAIADNYTLGSVMQKVGYNTVAIGKWGLQGDKQWSENGNAWPAEPLKRGFDHFYGYMRHSDGHEHYPNEGLYAGKKEVYDDHQAITTGLDKCYTGDLWTAMAKKYIIDHENGKDKDKPFLMYLAYDTPHAVLELPATAYPSGFGLNGGVQWLGESGKIINTASGIPDSFIDPEYIQSTYDDDKNPATPETAWPNVYKRYATIIKRIDLQVHDVLTLLKDLKIDKNTLVIFTSDNGPSIESYIKNEPFKANFFESFGPYDGIKRDVWEGGVREPTLVYWPGHIAPATKISNPSIAYDWMPTVLDVAGYKAPVKADGVSLLPELIGKSGQQKSQIYVEYFQGAKTPGYPEFDLAHRNRKRGQMQMMRFGDTVAIRYNIQSPEDDFEIYNIKKDPKQSHNLAKTEDLKQLEQYLKGRVLQMRMADSSAPRPYDNALIPANRMIPSSLKAGWRLTNYQTVTDWISTPNKNEKTQFIRNTEFEGVKNTFFFEGYVDIPEDGYYTFSLQTQGKAFVRLQDIALIDEDEHYQQGSSKSATVHLAKGYHRLKIYVKKLNGVTPKISFTMAQENQKSKDINEVIYVQK
nr:sulfatase-like hydrolase/transferase [uncultured Pedobacter sp.]